MYFWGNVDLMLWLKNGKYVWGRMLLSRIVKIFLWMVNFFIWVRELLFGVIYLIVVWGRNIVKIDYSKF